MTMTTDACGTINLRPRTAGALESASGNADSIPLHQDPTQPRSQANAGQPDWSGKSLGEYEIGRLLGAGGNGQVFLARHRWLDIPVAVKFLAALNPGDESVVARFRREATTSAKLVHPNLIRATDGGMVGNQLFLVTEFVDGVDLSQLVGQHGPLSLNASCAIIHPVCQALGHAAARDVVHRDIKPSNIMLDRTGSIKVLDLGLARINNHSNTMTETGQVMGTVDFMAPEQAVDPRSVDFRADLYSLGCTFYFLLTGRAPFQTEQHETIGAKLLAHMEADYTPISRHRQDIPRPIADLIDRMLAKDPKQRPASFAVVQKAVERHAAAADLSQLVAGETPHGTAAGTGVSWSDRVADAIVDYCKLGLKHGLVVLGFLQVQPKTRPGGRTTFQPSFRWLKGVAALAAAGVALWATGFRFEWQEVPPHPDAEYSQEYVQEVDW